MDSDSVQKVQQSQLECANLQESLNPQRIKKGEACYQSVLDIAARLEKEDATNIALTGPFGSGKSSVLLSLQDDFKNYNYLNISLATLKPLDGDKETEEISVDRLVEYSILQQLIYREKARDLKDSRIKRISYLSNKEVNYAAGILLTALICIIIVFEPSFLRVEWLSESLSNHVLNIVADIVCLLILGVISFFAIRSAIPTINRIRVNRINIKDGGIEIAEKNASVFNKHLDEIIYFFERTKYSVVIIEDLDRFESIGIFLKLRELNQLLNQSKIIGRKIFFIYAVRDDMFKDTDRVKCFDYITTVIPVVNRSNARNKLKEELEKRGQRDEISSEALKALGPWLNDMRMIKNISNEFVQYSARLSPSLSKEKLLAMIIYKNYHPDDFAKLHDSSGYVYGFFRLRKKLEDSLLKVIEEKNDSIEKMRSQYYIDRALSESELRRIYVDEYFDHLGETCKSIVIDGERHSRVEIAQNESLFNNLISNSKVSYFYVGYQYGRGYVDINDIKDIAFKVIQDSVNPEFTYEARLSNIRTDYDRKDIELEKQIRKDDIKSKTFSQILLETEYTSLEEYKKLSIPKDVEILIKDGYIDEDYYDYISYFYDNIIDSHDWSFVLDVKLGRRNNPYDHVVHNVKLCIDDAIPNYAYRGESILNIFIVDFLANHMENRLYKGRLFVIARTIIEKKRYDFLAEYYEKVRSCECFFDFLFAQFKGLWTEFDSVKDDHSDTLKIIWYKYAEKEYSCDESVEWLSSHYGFITNRVSDISPDLWIGLIRQNKYRFKNLVKGNDDILKGIASNNAFVLSKENLALIVSVYLKRESESVSLSLVFETGIKELIDYVVENLEHCLTTVFSPPEGDKELNATIKYIVNDKDISAESKIDYLSKQQNRIDIVDIEQKTNIEIALKSGVIAPTWGNVVSYLKQTNANNPDELICSLIERCSDDFANCELPEDEGEQRLLLQGFVGTDVLSYEAYNAILSSFSGWSFRSVPKVEDRRVLLLIEKSMIKFSTDNLAEFSSREPVSLFISYIHLYKKQFLSNLGCITYTPNLADSLLSSHVLTNKEKCKIVPYLGTEIVTETIADCIARLILNHKGIVVGKSFLKACVSKARILKDKLTLINYGLKNLTLDESEIKEFLRCLPSPYRILAERRKSPSLPNNSETGQLVGMLVEKGLVYPQKNDNPKVIKNIRVYTKR